MGDRIITIGRQYKSGGHDIGKALANRLGIAFYDRDLLKQAAKESGLCESVIEELDEKHTSSFLYSLVMDPYSLGYNSSAFDMPLNHKVFLASFEAIKKIAANGPCVIVGRCADYALADTNNCLNVFIDAPIEYRAKRLMEIDDSVSNLEKAKDIINKTDKQRSSYYNYYTTKKWGHIKSYDICLNSSTFGMEGTVDILEYMYKNYKK